MWTEIDADAERADFRCRLEYRAFDAGRPEHQTQGQPTDAPAGN